MVGISLGDPSIGKLSESAMCTRKGYIRSETYRVTTAGIPCGMTCDPNYRARIELLVNPTGHGPSELVTKLDGGGQVIPSTLYHQVRYQALCIIR